MSRNLSEQDLYALFGELDTDDMPSGMAARIERNVLAEVQSTLQPGAVASGSGVGWFTRIFENINLPNVQLLPSYALGGAAAAVIVILMLNPNLVNRLIGLDTGPNTGAPGSAEEVAEATPTTVPAAEVVVSSEAPPTPAATPIPATPTATPVVIDEPAAEVEPTESEELIPADNSAGSEGTGPAVVTAESQGPVVTEAQQPSTVAGNPAENDNSGTVGSSLEGVGNEGASGGGSAAGNSEAGQASGDAVNTAEAGQSESNDSNTGDDSGSNNSEDSVVTTEPASSSIALASTPTNTPINLGAGDLSQQIPSSTATPSRQPTRVATTASSSPTPMPTATNTVVVVQPTVTRSNVAATAVPTNTPVATRIQAATIVAASPSPTASLTPTSTFTNTPESTPEPVANDSDGPSEATETKVPTKTPTAPSTPVQSNTNTPVPTETETAEPTGTSTGTSTPVPTGTATPTATVKTAPLVDNYSIELSEDTEITVDLLDRITDVDDDSIDVKIIKSPSSGTLTVQNGSVVTYKPNADFNGEDQLIIMGTDSSGLSNTGIVTLVVTKVNDLPKALGDNRQAAEDTPLVVDVLANDTDVDNDVLTLLDVGDATNGTVNIVDGKVNYQPNPNFTGNDSFTYTVGDGSGQVSAIVNVQIEPVQDSPVTSPDTATVNEDDSVVVNVLANDTDVDGDPLQVIEVFEVNGGTVEIINEGAALRFTPLANANGTAQFAYRASDRNSTAVGRVTVQINPVPDAPQAVEDVVATQDDRAIVIEPLANDVDIDGDALNLVELATLPASGVAELLADNTVRYTPNINSNGSDTFTYRLEDATGLSSEGQITVNVTAFNDLPVAQPDEVTGAEDSPLLLDVLANDSDPDGNALAITRVSATDKGIITFEGAVLRFVPNANFTGVVEVTYDVSDGSNVASSVAKFIITPVQDAPVAQDDPVASNEDTPVDILVLGNDIDVDGEALTIVAISEPSFGTAVIEGSKIVYTPLLNFFGADSFTYTISDGVDNATATVSISVAGVNDPPTVQDKQVEMPEDTPAGDPVTFIDVLAGATDPENSTLTIAQISLPPANGIAVVTPDNLLQYTPNPNFNGEDVVKLLISDGGDALQESTVTIKVTAVADSPIAGGDEFARLEDTPSTLDVLVNDVDPELGNNSTLTIVAVSQPANNHIVTLNPDNTLRFTPAANVTGVVSFTYKIVSTSGSGDATGLVIVNIDAVNDSPVAVADVASMVEDGPAILINVLANDTDVDTPADQLVIGLPAQDVVGLSIEANQIKYQPPANFSGSVVIKYTVTDQASPPVEGTVNVTVTPVNDAPVAAPDNEAVTEGQAVTILALANDGDVDGDPLTVHKIGTEPVNGVATIVNGAEIVYTPNAGFVGTETFTYILSDGQSSGEPILGNVTIEVAAAPGGTGNLAPVAVDDTAEVVQGQSAALPVIANDSDADSATLEVLAITQPFSGIAAVDPGKQTITYTPNPDFVGVDTFTYTVSDDAGATATAAVTVTVLANSDQASENTPPADNPTNDPTAGDGNGDDAEVDASGTFSLTYDSPAGTGIITATAPITTTVPVTP